MKCGGILNLKEDKVTPWWMHHSCSRSWKGTSQDKVSVKTKLIALAVIKICLSESISELVSRKFGFLVNFWNGLGRHFWNQLYLTNTANGQKILIKFLHGIQYSKWTIYFQASTISAGFQISIHLCEYRWIDLKVCRDVSAVVGITHHAIMPNINSAYKFTSNLWNYINSAYKFTSNLWK